MRKHIEIQSEAERLKQAALYHAKRTLADLEVLAQDVEARKRLRAILERVLEVDRERGEL